MAKVHVVLNRAGVRELLQSDQVGAYIESLVSPLAPSGTVVSRVVGRSRQNVRVTDPSEDALDREANTGHLSRILGLAGGNKQQYTTKSGKVRWATEAQVKNWTRGAR